MNGITHRQKVDHLIAYLGQQGISPYTVAPPIFRGLWVIGINVPPPHFMRFVPLTLLMGTFFGVIWGMMMWLLQWQSGNLSAELAAIISVGAGLLFGLILAGYYRRKAAKLALPSWERYPGA